MQFFKDELLSYLGITAEPVTIGPTEFVHLEAKQLYEDFNFIKPDRSWIHLEFESDGIREEDLRRFRSYEAVTAFIRSVDITESGTISESDMVRMQAVLYTLANKFLSKDDLNQVKEALFMTPLGQMLVNDGIEKGMEMGMEKGIKKGIEKGASALISACQEVGLTYDSTRKKLIEKLEVDASTASRYMEEFWSVLSKQ